MFIEIDFVIFIYYFLTYWSSSWLPMFGGMYRGDRRGAGFPVSIEESRAHASAFSASPPGTTRTSTRWTRVESASRTTQWSVFQ